MNVSYEWLRSLVPYEGTPAALRDLITSRVAVVDELIPLRADLAAVVVARVLEAAPHPDSDHLSVTKVDDGSGTALDVICGAPNVRAGKMYPFARTGTLLPNGTKIERRKIRGAVSNGMLCSAKELGLGEEQEGILELDVDVAPGTPFLQAVPVGDSRLVIDVMPNRPDLLSHVGVAREVAAAIGKPLTLPELEASPSPTRSPQPAARSPKIPAATRVRGEGKTDAVKVRVDEPELARRYMGVVIRGIKVGSSPAWLARRLEAIGSRAINNVVDATNYVLHELGQPTHAFDLDKLAGQAVVVRRARAGERLTTLDGVDRALDANMTVIADAKRPIAIAGVMGGRDSEVTEGTTNLFLEVASFDPTRTRSTRRALALSSDASYRFERGVDPALAPEALERVARLIVALAGGEIAAPAVDIYAGDTPRQAMTLRVARLATVLGETVPATQAAGLLCAVGFEASAEESQVVRVVPPTWRSDIVLEVDLVEEVARLRGYDSFPVEIRAFRPGNVPDDPQWLAARRIRNALVGAGLLETRPVPFVRGADTGFWRVTNPIAESEAYLRREILDTLARRAEFNLSRMQGNLRLFEIGSAFLPSDGAMPVEELHVGALIMGRRRPPHFSDPKTPEAEAAATIDEWDIKALAELLARESYPGRGFEIRAAENAGEVLWTIDVDGGRVGSARRVPLDAPPWAKPAYGVEISLGRIESADVAPPGKNAHRVPEYLPTRIAAFRPLPATPASEFDLALVVPDKVRAAEVERVIRETSGDLLESVELLDLYAGKNIEPGHRSLAWRLTFRHPERTLSAKEIEGRRSNVLRQLERALNVRQRTS